MRGCGAPRARQIIGGQGAILNVTLAHKTVPFESGKFQHDVVIKTRRSCREEEQVHRRADRIRVEAGRAGHACRGGLPQDGDQRRRRAQIHATKSAKAAAPSGRQSRDLVRGEPAVERVPRYSGSQEASILAAHALARARASARPRPSTQGGNVSSGRQGHPAVGRKRFSASLLMKLFRSAARRNLLIF